MKIDSNSVKKTVSRSAHRTDSKSIDRGDKVNISRNKEDKFLKKIEELRTLHEAKSTEKTFQKMLRDPQIAMNFVQFFNNKLNLKPELLKEKYTSIMKADAHTFFRAIPSLFYYDLRHDYSQKSKLLDRPAPQIMINGDVHLKNFGTLKGPDRTAVWGLSDFDQTEKGSPEWDLERLATSAALVAKAAGLSKEQELAILDKLGEKYFSTIKKIATKEKDPHEAYLRKDETGGKISDMVKKAEETNQKDFLEDYVTTEMVKITKKEIEELEKKKIDTDQIKDLLDKEFTEENLTAELKKRNIPEGQIEKILKHSVSTDKAQNSHFIHGEEILPVNEETKEKIRKALVDYEKNLKDTPRMERPVRILDIAEKLGSGGSSYGLPRYYVLVAHADPEKPPVIMETKELLPIGLDDDSGELIPADGKTLVSYQKSVQPDGNPLIGATSIDGKSYLVREFEREKANTPIEEFDSEGSLESLVKQAAEVLAFAHGRTITQAEEINNWVGEDNEKAISRLKEFAIEYSENVRADYKLFKETM